MGGFRPIWLCLLLCCAPVVYPPPLALTRIDTSALTESQRAIVVEAEDSWARQTRGCVRFVEGRGIVVVPMDPPTKYDTQGKYTLGMTTPGSRIELDFSRMGTHDRAVIVVAHELGHILGLPHSVGPHALMNADIGRAWIGLSAEDRAELAIKTACY